MMHRSKRLRGWRCAAGFLLLFSGCNPAEEATLPEGLSQSDAPSAAPPAAQAAPASTTAPAATRPAVADTPARPASPASLQEAARIIDLRTFPMLERDELFYQTATKIGYGLAKPDLVKDLQFYRGKLTEAGWKLEADDINPELRYGSLRCSKRGFSVSMSVAKDPNTGKMMVFVENQGNIDARTLPRFPGAELTQSQPNVTIYRTDGKLDAVAEFVRTELKKLGWREVVGPDGVTGSEPGVSHCLMFIQHGMHFNALIDVKDGKSEVMNHVSMLKVGLPIMPDALGRIEHMEEPYLHLFYATPAKPEKVLEFYHRELPALGWSFRAGTDKIEDGKANVALEGPDKEPLRLELLAKDGPTFVLIAPAVAGK